MQGLSVIYLMSGENPTNSEAASTKRLSIGMVNHSKTNEIFGTTKMFIQFIYCKYLLNFHHENIPI